MGSNERLTVAVIPCLNEADTIGSIVETASRFVGGVWVVDDGSADPTRRAAEKAGAIVIRHEVNLGKGASIRDGFAAARAAGYRWAVSLDGDGQHDPAEIPKFIEAAVRGADLAIGNRMEDCGEMSPLRRRVNRWMSQRIEKRLEIPCPDSQCGFRLARLDAWATLSLRRNHYEVESEMLMAFARANFKVRFVPIRCLPARRKSRIHPITDTIRWLRWWLNSPS